MKAIVLAIAAALSQPTFASNLLHVTWTNPTTRLDGSPFTRKELAQIQIDVDGVVIGTFKSAGIDKQSYDYTLKCWKAGRVVGIVATDTRGVPSTRATVLLPYRASATCK